MESETREKRWFARKDRIVLWRFFIFLPWILVYVVLFTIGIINSPPGSLQDVWRLFDVFFQFIIFYTIGGLYLAPNFFYNLSALIDGRWGDIISTSRSLARLNPVQISEGLQHLLFWGVMLLLHIAYLVHPRIIFLIIIASILIFSAIGCGKQVPSMC